MGLVMLVRWLNEYRFGELGVGQLLQIRRSIEEASVGAKRATAVSEIRRLDLMAFHENMS